MDDKRKKVVALICKYLHEKKALEGYIYNVCKYHDINVSDMNPRERTKFIINGCLDRLLGRHELLITYLTDFFISCSSSFEWLRSAEGDNFWYKLSKEWHAYIYDKNEEFNIGLKEY